jgi:FKBP-type peptidyl-prolyl cis-trans isomerase
VSFNCTTKRADGSLISSTLMNNGSPITVGVNNTIPAWKEAILNMHVGSKWDLFVHPKLAYGEKGGDKIGPNELLIFRIELVSATR